ncbi:MULTISPECIES: hypothetical protein [unclassified Sphingomonas]|uniref:hypothetical protein n=1 Tax=unclassified Sphingomonas TaxID=196159 RepID=UPI001ACD9584|nr:MULTISPECIES: hypothetical protein [unclassified Sphingomonas]MBN8846831.1 hypothetical protein [Sphingomonas sp.]
MNANLVHCRIAAWADWRDWRNPIKVEEYGAPLSTGPKIKITPRSGSLTSR